MMDEIQEMDMELIWFEQVPFYFEYNEEAYERAMESLVEADPRVIVFQGDAGYAPLCWFHRYGLYGPTHAIFIVRYADSINKTISIPDYVSEWCTIDMVLDMMNHTFVYGENNRADLLENEADDVGMTLEKWNDEIHTRVEDIESAVWLYESSKFLYYDLMLFTGFMLDEAERLLRLKNDSLINWSVGSENFQQNGKFISDIFKQAIFNVRVVGMRGIYSFDENLGWNSFGSTPITIQEISTFKDRIDIDLETVAIFNHSSMESNQRVTIFYDNISWGTVDGKPPFDRVQIIQINVPSLNFIAIAILMAFVAVLMLITLFRLFYRKYFNQLEINLFVIGVFTCNLHIFMLPIRDVEPVDQHCSLLAAFIMFGTSMCFLSMWSLLERQLSNISKFTMAIQSNQRTSIGTSGRKMTKKRLLMAICIVIVKILAILFVTLPTVDSIGHQLSLDDTFNRRQVNLPTRKDCLLKANTSSMAIVCSNVAILVPAMLRSLVVTFKIRNLKKSFYTLMANRRYSNRPQISIPIDNGYLFIFMLTLVMATALIFPLVPTYIFYVTSFSSLLLVSGICLEFLFRQRKTRQ